MSFDEEGSGRITLMVMDLGGKFHIHDFSAISTRRLAHRCSSHRVASVFARADELMILNGSFQERNDESHDQYYFSLLALDFASRCSCVEGRSRDHRGRCIYPPLLDH